MESSAAHHQSAADERGGGATFEWIRVPGVAEHDPRLAEVVGAKGASLCCLAAAGFPVPPWFTIVTAACRWYHAHARKWPPQLWDEVQSALTQFEVAAAGGIDEQGAPLRLAVRSGASASMPGLMATRLDVDRGDLRDAITEVFDSWESAGARQYRALRGWTAAEGTSVIVQVMYPAEVSGVAFSSSPSDADALDVEAVAGLGMPLVGGLVTPARWSVHRTTGESSRRGDNRNLDAALREFERTGLNRLCRDVERIETLFGEPVDVEFGFAQGATTYFQARPIAAAVDTRDPEEIRSAERRKLESFCLQDRCWWARHNLAESLPAPTPLTWDLWREFMSGGGGFGALHRRFGYRPSSRVATDGFLELIGGRIFADVDRLPEMLCPGFPLAFDRTALRDDPSCLDRAPTALDPERLDRWFLLRWPAIAWTLFRAGRRQQRLMRDAASRFDGQFVPMLREYVACERSVDLRSLSTRDLVALFEKRRQWVFHDIAPQTLLPGMLGVNAWGRLERKLNAVLGPRDAAKLADQLLRTINQPTLRRQHESFALLAAGNATLDDVLEQIGHRGPGELELSEPRWREQPERLRQAALTWTSRRTEDSGPEAAAPSDLLHAAFRETGAACLARDADRWLQSAVQLLPYREIGKDEFLRAYELLRNVFQELSRRWGLGAGIYFLTADEIRDPPPLNELQAAIAARRAARQVMLRWELPAVLELPADLERFPADPAPSPHTARVHGIPLSGGIALGRACRLADADLAPGSAVGAVVVADTIDAGTMPFLADVAAIVVDRGGALSHVALMARQLGIPAVAAQGLPSLVTGGELLRVDGDQGTIEFPERAQ